jgi:GTP-binding protein Era
VVHDSELVLVVVDAARKIDEMNLTLLQRLEKEKESFEANKPLILVFNKIDLVSKQVMLPKVDAYTKTGLFDDTFFVSALEGTNVASLKEYLKSKAISQDWTYPRNWRSDKGLAERAEEAVRESIYERLNAEIPHQLAQETSGWGTASDGGLIICQNLLVPNRRVQKIVVGSGGKTIKCISMRAGKELEKLFNKKIHLFLQVKVQS